MPLELHILSGSRAGQNQRFEHSRVTIGRHPACDLQFDRDADLEVSGRHAEVRDADGRYLIHDASSTNGTFVNGRRIRGERELRDGDVLSFGERGPRVAVHIPAGAAAPTTSAGRAARRASTTERIAVVVQEHTRGLRRMLLAAVVLLGPAIGLAWWFGHRESSQQVAQLQALLAHGDSVSTTLQGELLRVGTSGSRYAAAVRQADATLRTRVQGSLDSPQAYAALREELHRSQVVQQGLALMDLSSISERNDAAVAFLVAELDGRTYGGTAFGITPGGLLVTNRHTVWSSSGHAPTRLAVKFANTDRYLRAHVVKVSRDSDADLALVQVDEPGRYPVVAGIVDSLRPLKVGAPVVTIGFPHSLDTPMAGDTVKTSLAGGVVSKKLDAVLQIDSYASHGSSGSPIFDIDGNVVGVLYGGAPESDGRLVYAVPSRRLAAFLPRGARAILR